MSETPEERLTLDEIITRIERQQAETRKFSNESFKLAAETGKLIAEAGKLTRDRWLAPIIAVASIIGAIGASLAAYGTLVRLAGGHG
jgi:hypothetical protein